MLDDSADAVLVALDIDDIDHVGTLAIKTMTAVRTVEAARILRHKNGVVVSL